ncbi:MAG: hypothetical protein K1V80_01010 [Muribaculaceae bacterium]|uniref:hypothetical protein n=1 Tax=uncultured Muribaculum sp. TaxID=1918613 RepID=UPI0026ED9A5C|nr:hypothetical protein [uncultured Muribaculum sp.]
MAKNDENEKIVSNPALNGALSGLQAVLNPIVSAHKNIGNIIMSFDKATETFNVLDMTVDITGAKLNNSVTAVFLDADLKELPRPCEGMVVATMDNACLVAFNLAENGHGLDAVLLVKLDYIGEMRVFVIKPGSYVTSEDLAPLTTGLTNANKRIDEIKNTIQGNQDETYVAFVYDFDTKTFALDECVGNWAEIPVHNKLPIVLLGPDGPINDIDLYGTVLSNSPESILIAFSVAENDCNMNATVLAHCDKALENWSLNILNGGVMATVDALNKLTAEVDALKANTPSGPNTWRGALLEFVEDSKEYTVFSNYFSWSDIDKVQVGDIVTFDVRGESIWEEGKLIGKVDSIAYELKINGGRIRDGFTVFLDPWYGTSWKYRRLKIRFTQGKVEVLFD